MKVSLFVFFTTLLVIGQAYVYQTTCSCPTWDGSYPDTSYVASSQSSTIQKSASDEIIGGINYGKLINYAGKVWLGVDVKGYSSASQTIKADCPSGYRVPTGDELRNLIQTVKTAYPQSQNVFLISQFGLNNANYYITTEKKWPANTDGSDNEAYRFFTLSFDQKTSAPVLDYPSTYWIQANLKAKCVLDSSTSAQNNFIANQTGPLLVNKATTLTYSKNNVLANVWRVNNVIIGKIQTANWTPDRAGCHVIESFLKNFGGSNLRQCQILWAELPFGSSKNTVLNVNKITSKVFTDFTVNLNNNMHFTPSSAPIAPKADGGAYVLFATKDTMDLYVRVLDNNGNQARTPIALNRKGYPFDIISTPWGFVSLIKDKANENYLYLLGYNDNGSQKFIRTIMNNGPNPTTCTDQIKFYESDGSQPFGMKAMFKPHNGRLAYFRGRINVIFAHYNHFGYYDTGARNDHTGDTVFTFDENGNNERLVFSWGASHSLIQNLVTSESMVFGASLSDAYPNNIRFYGFGADVNPNNVDPITKLKNRIDSVGTELISGFIPGNGGGSSCGNLGAVSYLGNNLLAATYHRLACTTTYSSNNKNEVGIVFYYANFTKIKEVTLLDGSKVNIVKSAKYGNNILIAIGVSAKNPDPYPARGLDPTKDVLKFMLVSPQGTILFQTQVVTPYSLTANDDFEVLSDGSVVWGFVNASNQFVFYKLPVIDSLVLVQRKLKHKKTHKSNVLVDKINA